MKKKKPAKITSERRAPLAAEQTNGIRNVSSGSLPPVRPASPSLDKGFLCRNIHESLQPIHRLANKADMPFLAYLIGVAMEEALDSADRIS